MQSGKTIDSALQQVYNLDTDSLDNAWRDSLGFPPIASSSQGTPTPGAKRTAVPTMALWTTSFGQSGGSLVLTPATPPLQTDIVPVTPAPQMTETPCEGSAPCINPQESPSPTSEAVSSAATAATTTTSPKSSSPIRCLGGNLAVALVLASILIYLTLIRRIYN
jgi:hypothetical protein